MYGNLVSLGGTNGKALEEEMAAHSSILAWKIQIPLYFFLWVVLFLFIAE